MKVHSTEEEGGATGAAITKLKLEFDTWCPSETKFNGNSHFPRLVVENIQCNCTLFFAYAGNMLPSIYITHVYYRKSAFILKILTEVVNAL